MIAVDTNVLVYAHRRDAPLHERARLALAGLAEGRSSWAIPWPCVHEFMAIATHPRIFDPPTPLEAASAQVDAWLRSPSLALLGESSEHWVLLSALLADSEVSGPRVHDARVAAICFGHGVSELWSADRDFSRFPHLKTRNPLATEL